MTDDVSRTVVITNEQGLHLRPAHAFVSLAATFTSDVRVSKDGETVDGKSILSLVTLAAAAGSEVTVRAEGVDAADAVAQLADLLENLAEQDAPEPE